jgi:two-component system chemotaxis sensor kinase CheA
LSFQSLAGDFAREALELIDQLEESLLSVESLPLEQRQPAAAAARRTMHTLKGNAGLVGAFALQAALHQMEDMAEDLGKAPEAAAALLKALDAVRIETREIAGGRNVDQPSPAILSGTLKVESASDGTSPQEVLSLEELRVPQARIDQLVATAGDLVVQNARLQGMVARGGSSVSKAWHEMADRLDASIRRLHAQLLQARMIPAGQMLSRFRRLVRDEAAAHGKRATLRVTGGDVGVDKAVLDQLSGALVHLIRNAIAHGIERPEERVAAGKAPEGALTLSAAQCGDRVEIAVQDDGRGLDHQAIAQRARELGLDATLGDIALIFEAGFSTAPLSQSAGRGVGLDAVKRAVYGLGGTLDVTSTPGAGTRFLARVPSSIALQRALLCRIAGETYAVPVASVLEAARIGEPNVRWLGNGEAVEHRGSLVPLVDQARLLGVEPRGGNYAVILQADGLAALRVEAVVGQQDFVFQPIDSTLRGSAPTTAGALLADGRVVLRLDPDALVASTVAARRSEVKA